jgi:hypothetical protein
MRASRAEQHAGERPGERQQPDRRIAADGRRRPADQERDHEPGLLDDERNPDEAVRAQVELEARLEEERLARRASQVDGDLDRPPEEPGRRELTQRSQRRAQFAPASSVVRGTVAGVYPSCRLSSVPAPAGQEAALAAYPGGIVDRVVQLSNGEYEVHYIGVNWPHHVFVNQDFKVIGAN